MWEMSGEALPGSGDQGVCSMSSDGMTFAIASSYRSVVGIKGRVQVYTYVEPQWKQVGGDIIAQSSFFQSVSVSLFQRMELLLLLGTNGMGFIIKVMY